MADHSRIEELRRRIQKDPASIAFAQLAEEYRRAGRLPEAIEAYRTALSFSPQRAPRIYNSLGAAYLMSGSVQRVGAPGGSSNAAPTSNANRCGWSSGLRSITMPVRALHEA